MRQHAIPQNVLDVEFKIFTKFTLKEFAYLAMGIGFGGLILFLFSKGYIPGILAIPVFIVSSGLGIFLGLVPINDQDADKFLKSYFNAINAPTQRAWLSKEMKKERTKPSVKPTEDGRIVATDQKTKPKIVGAGLNNTTKTTEQTIEEANQYEKQQVEEKVKEDTETPKQLDNTHIVITDTNIKNYQFPIKGNYNGNINIWLCTKDYKPIPNVITYLKDSNGKMLYANKTGKNGYFLSGKNWEEGKYEINFEHPDYKFPTLEMVINKKIIDNKLPIKINAL